MQRHLEFKFCTDYKMHFLILNFMTTFLQDYNNKLFFLQIASISGRNKFDFISRIAGIFSVESIFEGRPVCEDKGHWPISITKERGSHPIVF